MSEPIIALAGLTKSYGDLQAVRGLSLRINRGEIFGFLGANGAGKTTTMRMLCGLVRPTSGAATIGGADVWRERYAVRRKFGYMAQKFSLYPDLTVLENLRFFGGAYRVPPNELEARMERILGQVDLPEKRNTAAGSLSGGMRQLLALGCALVHEPPLLFLDEPTSGLDPQATLELLDMIRGLKREGVSVLLSSHLLDRVQSVCDRVALFQEGRIVLMGTVAELGREVLGGGFAVEVEAEGQGLAERLAQVPGVRTVEAPGPDRFRLLADRDVRPDAAAAVVNAGGRLRRLSVEEPSLEAIYTRYFHDHGARHAA